jgi:predicted methyltransferase
VSRLGIVRQLDVKAALESELADLSGILKSLCRQVNDVTKHVRDQSFHLIVAFGLAHPVGSMKCIWAALYRFLKPGGILSIQGRLRPPDKLFQPVKRQGRISQFREVG